MAKRVEANKEFPKTNASNTSSKKYKVFVSQVIVRVLLWNEMHCRIQYDGFPHFQTLMASIFSFKIQLAEMSKQKQVQRSLNTFFRGKQDQESNTTPTMPAAAPIKETRKFQESWKEKYKLAPLWWIRKQNVLRVCKEFPNGKKHALFLRTGANNFQTDSLKGHKVHDASEGHAMSSAAKRTSERAREERP